MAQLLIFLGAGACKAFADIPTMKEMVSLFKDTLKSESQLDTLYSEIADSLKETYPDRLDLEAVFSVVDGISKKRTFKDMGFHATYEAKRLKALPSEPCSPETVNLATQL
jgi:hypothetical protein